MVSHFQRKLIQRYTGSIEHDFSIEEIFKEVEREGEFENIYSMVSKNYPHDGGSLPFWVSLFCLVKMGRGVDAKSLLKPISSNNTYNNQVFLFMI